MALITKDYLNNWSLFLRYVEPHLLFKAMKMIIYLFKVNFRQNVIPSDLMFT